MSCIYKNPLDNNNLSELHKRLTEIFATQEEADNNYALVNTKEFIDRFGDWEADYTKSERLFVGRTYSTGEPELKKNNFDQYYFEMENGEKYWLKRRILNYGHEDREFLVNYAMFQLFGSNLVTDSEAFENTDINQIFNDKSPRSIYTFLGGNMVDLQDIKTLVKQKLNQLKVQVIEREDINTDDNAVTRENTESGNSLNLITSQEKNSKDNASSNIKFLLSFLPVTDNDGNTEFAKFDYLWKRIEPVLAGTVDLYNDGTVISKFKTMLARLELAYPTDPTIIQVVETIKAMPDYKQNEFVHAFDKIKNDYQTSLIKKEGDNISFKFFSSDRAVTPAKKSINIWNANFKGSSFIVIGEDGKPQFDKARAGKLYIKQKAFEESIRQLKPTADMSEDHYIKLKTALEFIGISIDHNALRDYIFSFDKTGNDTLTNSMLLAATNDLGHVFREFANLDQSTVVKGLNVNNVFSKSKFKKQLDALGDAQAKLSQDLTENNIMGAESKKYWIYSQPSYLTNKLERLKNDPKSELPLNNAFYGFSIILDNIRENISDPGINQKYIDGLQLLMFNNFRQENEGDEGTDNSGMFKEDQITDNINKALDSKRGGNSVYYTPIPADKSKLYHLMGSHFFSTMEAGNPYALSSEILYIYENYLIDEINRIQEELKVLENIEGNQDRLYKDYHYKLDDNGKPYYYDKDGNPVGNAFKSILFPQFSPFNQSDEVKALKIFDNKGKLLKNVDTLRNNEDVRSIIDKDIQDTISAEYNQLEALGLITTTEDGKLIFKALDSEIMSKYKNDSYASDADTIRAAVSDYVVNSMIANVEFSKVFSGDYAFYKDLSDLSKRYPATYTDGTNINLKEGDNPNFKLAVLPNVILPSYALEEIKAYSPALAKAYSKINTTDAQGYITLDRWHFIMSRSNHWSPKYEQAYQRIKDGNPTPEDYKLAAQPIKGVHFEVSNGVPTYIKYSAAVLIPEVVKNTDLGKLMNDMIAQGIDEAVVIDGIKVGAKVPSDVLNTDGSYKDSNVNINEEIASILTEELQNNIFNISNSIPNKKIELNNFNFYIKKRSKDEFSISIDNKATSTFGRVSASLEFQRRNLDDNSIYVPNPQGFLLWDKFLNSDIAKQQKAESIVNNRNELRIGVLQGLKNNGIEKLHFPERYLDNIKKEFGNFFNTELSSVSFGEENNLKTVSFNIDQLISLLKNEIQTSNPLNSITLRNNNYKIQQDLRPKGIKKTLLGSQIKKTILTNFKDDEMYGGILGKDLKQEFFDILSAKSNFGLKSLSSSLGIDTNGNILNKSKLIEAVKNRISDRGITENLQNALEREYDLDYIANYRQKTQNALMSIINDATVNVKTNGASFIQMSSWGLNNKKGISTNDLPNSGIKMLVDNFESLKPPTVYSESDIVLTNLEINTDFGPDSYRSNILYKGKNIGEIGVSFSKWASFKDILSANNFEDKNVFISGVVIDDEFRNKGLGKEAYKQLLNTLSNRGFRVTSGINTSGSATRVWDSLVKEGIAKKEESTGEYFVDKPLNLDFKKKVTPGQVFVTSNYIAKFIPDWKTKSPEQLKKMIDSRLLKMIGYRIPNQGMSSNASLEIVGILPESMGDTIIPYIDITTQTGSDFDIDKMYVMIPNARARVSTKAFDKVTSLDSEVLIQGLLDNGWTEQAIREQTIPERTPKAKKKRLVNLIVEEGMFEGIFTKEELAEYVTRLEYKTYDNTKLAIQNSQSAVDNRLIELMQIILEDEKTYEALMSPLDNPFLKDDIALLHGTEDNKNIGNRFFSPLYQINKKFDNSGGKTGVGLTANQLTDHMWTQHIGMGFEENIGFSNINENGITVFDGEMDILKENKITDVLSWFLTAYVDIAKDPYITKGNHNEYTSNTTFMLLRGGAPISFINRLVGQPVVKKLAELDSLRKSRIADIDRRELSEAVIEDLNLTTNREYYTATEVIEDFNNGNSSVVTYSKRMENDIKNPDPFNEGWKARQLEYLDLYNYYHKIGQKFSKTVLSSKQDVNGGGKDPMTALTDKNKRTEAASLGFSNFMGKFNNTFLGTAYENSTELSLKLMSQLFVTSNSSAQVLYNATYKLISPNSEYGIVEPKLGFEMEKAYFAHILGQTSMARSNAEIRDMFIGNNTVYDKLLKVRHNNPDNYFLNLLNVDQIDTLKFVMMDSTRNNSSEALNEITRAWEDLLESNDPKEIELGKELITYSFYQSGFRSNIGSFFEHIPTDALHDMVEAGIAEAKLTYSGGYVGVNQFVDKFFRNNWQNDRLVPYAAKKFKNGKDAIVKGVLTVVPDTGTERGKHMMPYLKTTTYNRDSFGESIKKAKLWKNMGYILGENGKIKFAKFIEVSKLGYNNQGKNVYEYTKDISVDGDSMWSENNVKPNTVVIDAMNKAIKENKMLSYNAITENVSVYSALQNNNRNMSKDMDQANEDGLINCTG